MKHTPTTNFVIIGMSYEMSSRTVWLLVIVLCTFSGRFLLAGHVRCSVSGEILRLDMFRVRFVHVVYGWPLTHRGRKRMQKNEFDPWKTNGSIGMEVDKKSTFYYRLVLYNIPKHVLLKTLGQFLVEKRLK